MDDRGRSVGASFSTVEPSLEEDVDG